MGLGDNIRYLRIKRGFSQDYIAEKLGYKSYTTIQKWESGVSEPPVKKLKELSALLNADMNDMANKDLTSMENIVESQPNLPKIMQYYKKLNDLGKHEATKRVEELTYLPQYTASNEVKAARNDHINEEGELEKTLEDISNLKRPE